MAGSRARAYVFTHNNYTEEHEDCWEHLAEVDSVQYVAYGREVGESGTPHLQGMIYLKNAKTLTALKALLTSVALPNVHFEKQGGTFRQAFEYCTKDGDYVEHGVRPKQGRRTDLEDALDAAREHKSLKTALEDGSVRSFQALHGYTKLELLYRPEPPKWRKMRCMWLWGATGTGKTVGANELLTRTGGGEPFRPVTLGERIWMGYSGQATMIVDDVAEVKKEFLDAFNQVLGGGRCNIRISGGVAPCRITEVIITSHAAPQELFATGSCHERWDEASRRLNRGVFEVTSLLGSIEAEPEPHAELTAAGEALSAHFNQDALPAPLPSLSAHPAMGGSYPSHPFPAEADEAGAEDA